MTRTVARLSLLFAMSAGLLNACSGKSADSTSSSSSTGGAESGASTGGGASSNGSGASSSGGGHSSSHGSSSRAASAANNNNNNGGGSSGFMLPDAGPATPYHGEQEPGVKCDMTICDAATPLCCVGFSSAMCDAMCGGFGISLACDGPEDCPHNQVCCAQLLGSTCTDKVDCVGMGGLTDPQRVCGQDSDCEVGEGCCVVGGLLASFLTTVDFGTCQAGCMGGGNTAGSSSSSAAASAAAAAASSASAAAGSSAAAASASVAAASSAAAASSSAAAASSAAASAAAASSSGGSGSSQAP